jgi:hypothetical protein
MLIGLFDLEEVRDINGDGIGDLAAGSGGVVVLPAQVTAFDGATGTVEWWLPFQASSYGLALAGLGDVDGDGKADVAVGDGSFSSPLCGVSGEGRVSVRSGVDGSLVYDVLGFQCLSQFGFDVSSLPDLDGDGVRELVVAAPAEGFFNQPLGPGVVRVFSGSAASAGNLLWQAAYPPLVSVFPFTPPLNGPFPGTARTIGELGDLTGDGFSDLVFLGDDLAGRVVSGNTGQLQFVILPLILMFPMPGALWEPTQVRYDHAFVGDLDGDGVADLVGGIRLSLGVTGGIVVARSGLNGAFLWWVPALSATPEAFGTSLAGGEDWDGDGVPDVAVGSPTNGIAGGSVWVLSGVDGAARFHFEAPPASGSMGFGNRVASVPDVNGDGVDEIAISAPWTTVNGVPNTGEIFLYTLCDVFGSECVSSTGTVPRLRCAGGAASLGNASFGLLLRDAPVLAPAFLVLGTSNTSWLGTPLPLPLPSSMGCTLSVAPEVVFPPVVTSAAGEGAAILPIPNDPALAGADAFGQWVVIDSTGFVSTKGVRVEVLP